MNWQPPDTRVRYQIETDNGGTPFFVIYSYRFKPPEKMYVRFKIIGMISVTGCEMIRFCGSLGRSPT